MKIKVDYEECETCEANKDCAKLTAMKHLVEVTTEVLRDMATSGATPNEVQS